MRSALVGGRLSPILLGAVVVGTIVLAAHLSVQVKMIDHGSDCFWGKIFEPWTGSNLEARFQHMRLFKNVLIFCQHQKKELVLSDKQILSITSQKDFSNSGFRFRTKGNSILCPGCVNNPHFSVIRIGMDGLPIIEVHIDRPNISSGRAACIFDHEFDAPEIERSRCGSEWRQINICNNERALHMSGCLIRFIQYVPSTDAYENQKKREMSETASPSRHNIFISAVCGFAFLLLALTLIVIGFEASDYFEDCGFGWLWWLPLVVFVVLSIWPIAHGIDLLRAANRRSEDVGIFSVVVAELEFGDVQRQILVADLVETSHDPALNQRPKTFDCVGVNDSSNAILAAHTVSRVLTSTLRSEPFVRAQVPSFGLT